MLERVDAALSNLSLVDGGAEVDDAALYRALVDTILDQGNVEKIIQERVKTQGDKIAVLVKLQPLLSELFSYKLSSLEGVLTSNEKLNPDKFIDGLLFCAQVSKKAFPCLDAGSKTLSDKQKKFAALQRKELLDRLSVEQACNILTQLEGEVGSEIDLKMDQVVNQAFIRQPGWLTNGDVRNRNATRNRNEKSSDQRAKRKSTSKELTSIAARMAVIFPPPTSLGLAWIETSHALPLRNAQGHRCLLHL
jgi:hypothetical protein